MPAPAMWCSAPTSGFAASLDLAALDGTDGFRSRRERRPTDCSGYSVASARRRQRRRHRRPDRRGPVRRHRSATVAGASYVVFGTDTGFAASLDLAALDGTDGFRLDGDGCRRRQRLLGLRGRRRQRRRHRRPDRRRPSCRHATATMPAPAMSSSAPTPASPPASISPRSTAATASASTATAADDRAAARSPRPATSTATASTT